METQVGRPPEVVRERIDRLTGGRLSCALIFDREFSREEIVRFYSLGNNDHPAPAAFEIVGRVARYECGDEDEARYRLAMEIFLVKSFRATPKPRATDADVRSRFGLRPLSR